MNEIASRKLKDFIFWEELVWPVEEEAEVQEVEEKNAGPGPSAQESIHEKKHHSQTGASVNSGGVLPRSAENS